LDRWFDTEYWLSLSPGCTIGGNAAATTAAAAATPAAVALGPAHEDELRGRMDEDGYFELRAAAITAAATAAQGGGGGGGGYDYPALIGRLRTAVCALVASGWPASFVVVFDEVPRAPSGWGSPACSTGGRGGGGGGRGWLADDGACAPRLARRRGIWCSC
jgi:hypothetical protein